MPRFRKRPVEVEAMLWNGSNVDEVSAFMPGEPYTANTAEGEILIKTPEGVMRADPGDWIIKGVAGEFYPCKPEIFDQTYETV